MRSITLEQRKLYYEIVDGISPSDTARVMLKAADAFGFKATTLMIMPAKTDGSVADLIIESSLPREFHVSIDAIAKPKDCVSYEMARNTILPIVWSAEQFIRQSKLINAAPPAYIDLYLEQGLSSGILFPLFTLDGHRHIMRYDGDREPLEQRELNDLSMLTAHVFQTFDRSRYPSTDNPSGLTDRELEIVGWTATGKTSSEIGTILSLSDHTVNAYLNNAFKKLDCVNRVQLIAKALRMRLIS